MNKQEQQFSRIFEQNRKRIYRLCYSYLENRDLVDDLFQEIWLHIWRSLPSFRGEAQESTWVYRIAVNTALLCNKQTRRKRIEMSLDQATGQTADGRPSPENAAGASQLLTQLRQAIAVLPGQDRLLITLFLEGTTYREISEIIGISVNYVGVRLNRIRQALGKIVEET